MYEEGSFLSLTDEDGTEYVLEYVDTLEYAGERYMAFLPAEDGDMLTDPDDGDYGYVILRVEVQPDGEEMLVTVVEDAEREAVCRLLIEDMDDALLDDDEENEDD